MEAKNYALPVLVNTRLENAYHERELLGFPLSMTMFELLQTDYCGEVGANDLINHAGQYICEKTVHTDNNQRMWFGNFLDMEGNTFDTVHFPNRAPAYPFRGKGCYLILGKVVAEILQAPDLSQSRHLTRIKMDILTINIKYPRAPLAEVFPYRQPAPEQSGQQPHTTCALMKRSRIGADRFLLISGVGAFRDSDSVRVRFIGLAP